MAAAEWGVVGAPGGMGEAIARVAKKTLVPSLGAHIVS